MSDFANIGRNAMRKADRGAARMLRDARLADALTATCRALVSALDEGCDMNDGTDQRWADARRVLAAIDGEG